MTSRGGILARIMRERTMKREIFYDWVVLAAAFVIITLSIGTLFTLGVFLKPLNLFARDLGALYGLGLAFGVAYGGVMPLYALVTREYFGEKIMGTPTAWCSSSRVSGWGWAPTRRAHS